jgi:hypothetical protein
VVSTRAARNLELEGGGQCRQRRRERATGFEDHGRERSGGADAGALLNQRRGRTGGGLVHSTGWRKERGTRQCGVTRGVGWGGGEGSGGRQCVETAEVGGNRWTQGNRTGRRAGGQETI